MKFHVTDFVELAKCIDQQSAVIDGNNCYLVPRAVEQYSMIFDIEKSSIETTVKNCYKKHFVGGVLNYSKYYKCIETIQ